MKIRLQPWLLKEPAVRRAAFWFTAFLFVFETSAVGVRYSEYFAYLIDSETVFFQAVTLACMAAALFSFLYFVNFALRAAWPYKVITFLFFAFSVTAEYGYQKALDRFSLPTDIDSIAATTWEQTSGAIMAYLDWHAVVPGVGFGFLLVFIRSSKTLGLRHFIYANAVLGVCFTVTPTLIDQQFPTLATNAFYSTCLRVIEATPTAAYNANFGDARNLGRRTVPIPPLTAQYRPRNNIVVVIDESVRGDHLSINGYNRDTTPLLRKLQSEGILTNWGIAAAASTASRASYSAIVTGMTPDDFPDNTYVKINTFPTFFQYAKAMNYRTTFLDGQMNGLWGATEDDRRFLDSWAGPLEISREGGFNSFEIDRVIATRVKRIISSSTGNFVFVFKRGSHYPYQNNFPPEAELWRPSYRTDDRWGIPSGDDLPAVANSYDNSLRYHIDSFFGALVDDYSNIPNNTVIIYAGDHGQTLFVNGKATHGGKTREEANVPLFIVGKLPQKVDTSYKASHQNIFPTLLDLMNYPPELREGVHAPSLLKTKASDSRPRFFNPDLGVKIAFD